MANIPMLQTRTCNYACVRTFTNESLITERYCNDRLGHFYGFVIFFVDSIGDFVGLWG